MIKILKLKMPDRKNKFLLLSNLSFNENINLNSMRNQIHFEIIDYNTGLNDKK